MLRLAFHLRLKVFLTLRLLLLLDSEAMNGAIALVDEEQVAFRLAAVEAIDGKPERGRRTGGLILLKESALRVSRLEVLPGQGVGRGID